VADQATLADLMRTTVVSVPPDISVSQAAERMVARKVGSACVMEGSFLTGILTERDVLRAAASGADLTISTASEWMTPDPRYARPETPVDEAAQVMFRNGFRHLPILDGKHLCGIVSLRDLFAARIRRA
jgi:CBS domain-containing protein